VVQAAPLAAIAHEEPPPAPPTSPVLAPPRPPAPAAPPPVPPPPTPPDGDPPVPTLPPAPLPPAPLLPARPALPAPPPVPPAPPVPTVLPAAPPVPVPEVVCPLPHAASKKSGTPRTIENRRSRREVGRSAETEDAETIRSSFIVCHASATTVPRVRSGLSPRSSERDPDAAVPPHSEIRACRQRPVEASQPVRGDPASQVRCLARNTTVPAVASANRRLIDPWQSNSWALRSAAAGLEREHLERDREAIRTLCAVHPPAIPRRERSSVKRRAGWSPR